MPTHAPHRPPRRSRPSRDARETRGRLRGAPVATPSPDGTDASRAEPPDAFALLQQHVDRSLIAWRTWMAPWAP